MTTGRINQVTTIHLLWDRALRPLLMTQRPSSQTGVHQTSEKIQLQSSQPQLSKPQWNTLFPNLTNFKHISPCYMKQQRSWPSKRTTKNRSTKMSTAVLVYSQINDYSESSHRQINPHSPVNASTFKRY